MNQLDDRSWMPSGICASVSMDQWYPENGSKPRTVVRMCLACPVYANCVDYVMTLELGLKRHDRAGIWGGMFPHERIAYEPQWLAEQAEVAA